METKEVILAEISKLAKKKVNEDDFISDLNIDSLDLAMLVFQAEEKFNVRVPDEQLTKVQTVKDVILLFDK
ncbi:phosphopantetheine-binding protein [Mycoplasma hafezii]|uniref:phosphopantetheine-binding protein n=1 Tax=Mycoplasma hafezii TaxID=525886 RepID=UPI003CE6BB0D